jgi:hypothetical protein
MKSGSILGAILVLAALASAPLCAQNLGLGTGSRAVSPGDSLDSRSDPRDQAPPPRKNQINKRLGLSARRTGPFDPKVFEARGRELQGQFYEIGAPAHPVMMTGEQRKTGASLSPARNGSRQWLLWVGVAGAAGASAGVIGYFLMNNAHPASAPPDIPLVLDDKP